MSSRYSKEKVVENLSTNRTGDVDGSLQAVYIHPMEGILCRDVGDDEKVKSLLAKSLKDTADRLGLLLRTDSSHNAVPMFEEHINDMPGDEASATYITH